MRQKRLYLRYCEKSLNAIRSAVDSFNGVHDPYKIEITLILLTNAWESLGKAILVRARESILKDKHGNSFSAEQVISRLHDKKILDENQTCHIQQVISLRNEASHGILPPIPVEILHHLFYFSCKFYKDITVKHFPRYRESIAGNYLSISFSDLTTYADKVQKLVSKYRRGTEGERKVIWLLERGIRFEGAAYISQDKFEKEFKEKAKWKLLPHLRIGKFLKMADMVRVIPVQAPKNYTADVVLRKGKHSDAALPVVVKKTDVEHDYPYLTGELAQKLNKKPNYVAWATRKLGLKNKEQFHQAFRTSKSGSVQRYSESAVSFLEKYFEEHPNFNPFR